MKFDFTDAQTNQIVNILAARPFNEVFELISEIQKQAAQNQRQQQMPLMGDQQMDHVNGAGAPMN